MIRKECKKRRFTSQADSNSSLLPAVICLVSLILNWPLVEGSNLTVEFNETTTSTTTTPSYWNLVRTNGTRTQSRQVIFLPTGFTSRFELEYSNSSNQTTSTTTKTSTKITTTTTKAKPRYDPFIIDFKLIEIVYNRKSKVITIDYLLQTNISSINLYRRSNASGMFTFFLDFLFL